MEERKNCPDCKTKLEIVSLSDLVAEKKQKGMDAAFSLISIVFNYLVFYVCSKCGRTLVYSKPDVMKKAYETSEVIIGNS